jgi:Rrf2 family protein
VKLSFQEEYGLRCLLQVARQDQGESLTIPELARLEGISAPNVAKFMRILRQGGLVKSTRGQAGGYALARPAEAISVKEALEALGGRLFDSNFCDRHSGAVAICTHLDNCSILPVLRTLQDVVDDVLGRMSLAQLLAGGPRPQGLANPRAVKLPMASRTA